MELIALPVTGLNQSVVTKLHIKVFYMNRTFKSIWNQSTGTFVAVAENVKSQGKRTSSSRAGAIFSAVAAVGLGAGMAAPIAMASTTVADDNNNIVVTDAGPFSGYLGTGRAYTVAIKPIVNFDSVTINASGVVLDANGINMNGNKIKHLDAGDLSATSRQAVNGSQLFQTNQDVTTLAGNVAQGLNFTGNMDPGFNRVPGGTVNIVGRMTNITDLNAASGANIRTVAKADGDLVIQMSKDLVELNTVTIGETAGDQTFINNGSIFTNSVATTDLDAGNGALKVNNTSFQVKNGTAINMGNNQVKNVADGDVNATSKQAVNGSQLFDTNQTVAGISTLVGQGLTFAGDNGADVVRPLGSIVKITGATGPGTHQNIDTTTNNDGLEIKLNNELRLTSSGSVKMGDTLVNNNGLTINGGPSMTKTNGIDAGGQKITGVLWGQNGQDAVNVNQLNAQNTALTNKGLNFAGNRGPGFNTPLGETVVIKGGMTQMAPGAASSANMRTVARDNGNLVIEMSKDLVDLDTVTVGDNVADQTKIDKGTITTNTINADDVNTAALNVGGGALIANGTSFAIKNGTSIDMGNNQITGVANGTAADHAVNLSQLDAVNATASAGWNIGSNGDPAVNVAPGGNVDFSSANANIGITQTGTDLEFELNSILDLTAAGSVTTGESVLDNDGLTVADHHDTTLVKKDGISITGVSSDLPFPGMDTTQLSKNMITVGGINSIQMDGRTGTITGLTNTDWTGDYGNNPGRAATEGQIKPMSDFLGLDASQGYTFEYNGQQHASLADALDSMHWNVSAPPATPGTPTLPGTPGVSTPIHNGNTVGFAGDNNISVSKTDTANGADISITLNKDIVVDTVTAATVTADDVVANNTVTVGAAGDQTIINKGDITATGTVTANTVNAVDINATGTVSASELAITNGPTINDTGIDMSGQQIRNLADGTARDHAVNLGQLNDVRDQLHSEVNGVRRDLHKVDRKLRAGVAAAMATAGLPQAYTPGKSMVAMGGGTWNGESGLALGVSKITDSGKWVIKASGNASTRGDYGGTVGAGYQW